MWTASGECSDFLPRTFTNSLLWPRAKKWRCLYRHNVVHDRVLLCHARDVDRLPYICTHMYIYIHIHTYLHDVCTCIYICTCMSTVTMYMRQLLWWFQDRLEESKTAVFFGGCWTQRNSMKKMPDVLFKLKVYISVASPEIRIRRLPVVKLNSWCRNHCCLATIWPSRNNDF